MTGPPMTRPTRRERSACWRRPATPVPAMSCTPPGGAPVTLTLVVGAEDPVAVQLAALVASVCQGLGIRVTVSELPGASGAGPPAAPGTWPSNCARYRSILTRSAAGTPPGVRRTWTVFPARRRTLCWPGGGGARFAMARLYDQVDQRAWSGLVDLPLVQVPVVVAVNSGLLNVSPGPYFANLGMGRTGLGVPGLSERAGRTWRATSCSSPSTNGGATAFRPWATRWCGPRTSTAWPPGACSSPTTGPMRRPAGRAGPACTRACTCEPPLGAQRDPARRPVHQRGARGPPGGLRPVLFGYTDTSVDPRTVPAGDPHVTTRASCPGFDAMVTDP